MNLLGLAFYLVLSLLLVASAALFVYERKIKDKQTPIPFYLFSIPMLLAGIENIPRVFPWVAPVVLWFAVSWVYRDRNRRFRKWITLCIAVLAVIRIVFWLALTFIVLPVFEFPTPSGKLTVGTIAHPWTNSLTPIDPVSPDGGPRELMVQFWYPATKSETSPRAPYLDHANMVTQGLIAARAPFLPAHIMDHFERVLSNSYEHAPLLAEGRPFPVIIFCHGYGGMRAQNTAQCEDLASHGFVVVAFDFPYSAGAVVYPGGRVAKFVDVLGASSRGVPGPNSKMTSQQLIDVWSRDVQFVTDQLEKLNRGEIDSPFKGALDMTKLGIMGHSFGGATASNICRIDPRFKAGLNMDGFLSDRGESNAVNVPFMYFMAGRFLTTAESLKQAGVPQERADYMMAGVKRIEDAAKANRNDSYLLVLKGSRHETFTDMPLYSPYLGLFGMGSDIPATRSVPLINVYTVAFFDRYLRGTKGNPLLSGASPGYPEVEYVVCQTGHSEAPEGEPNRG